MRRCAALRFVAALALLPLGGCVSLYVDNGVPDTPASAFHRPATPAPVQLLFTFKTKGVDNARATDLLRKEVTDAVVASGLFSGVGPAPVDGGALLGITIDNVPITSQNEAMAKGFATGLTFGLAGSEVTDGYVCTVEYIPHAGATKSTEVVRHMIHGTVGAHGAPANSTKAPSAEAAVRTMARQAVGAALQKLSAGPGFGP